MSAKERVTVQTPIVVKTSVSRSRLDRAGQGQLKRGLRSVSKRRLRQHSMSLAEKTAS
jgi:hypothetical protein